MTSYLLLGCVVLLTHFLEGITGFGCTVLALPFAILLIGTKQAVPVLLFLAPCWQSISSGSIASASFGASSPRSWRLSGSAFPLGFLRSAISTRTCCAGSSVHSWSSWQCAGCFYVVSLNESRLPKWVLNLLLVAGGFIHGVFSSGGPLVVIYARNALVDKSNFRATISMFWLSLNTVMLVQGVAWSDDAANLENHRRQARHFWAIGALAGNWAHRHIKDRYFSQIVYGVLLVSGLFMFRDRMTYGSK